MSTFNIANTFQQANILVAAHTTQTLYGSALVTMSPTSAISSVQITQIALRTPDTRFGTVSSQQTLPYTATNGSSILFSVIYDNKSLSSMSNTIAVAAVSAVATSANVQLASGSVDTNVTDKFAGTSYFCYQLVV